MKLLKKFLGVISLAFIGIAGLSFASPAQAYTINCFPLNAVQTWPDRDVLACGPAGNSPTATATTVLNAVKGLNAPMGDAYTKLQALQPTIFVFRTTAEMQLYYQERNLQVPPVSASTIAGQTIENAGVPLYTQVFENGAYPGNTAVHEMGHWFDYAYRGLAGGNPAKNRLSEMPLFRSMVLQDRVNLDRLQYPAVVTPKCGAGGLFSGAKDGQGVYICSSNGAGNTLNSPTYPNTTGSADVLDIGFKEIFDLAYVKAGQPETLSYREMTAEAYAVVEGNLDGGIQGIDKYFAGTKFNCTKQFVQKVGTSGVIPTQAELEGWGCAVPCVVYPNPTQANYPLNGHLFNCMGLPRNSSEASYQTAIMNSANAAVAGYGTDRTKLNAKNVDVYIFYNGVDALITKRIDRTGNSLTYEETGRSFVEAPVGNTTLPNASSLVYVYTQTEWAAQAGFIPAYYNTGAYAGTVTHELGHQMDRIWSAALGYAPAATSLISLNTTNQAYYLKALAWDWAAISAANKNTLKQTYFYLFQDPANPVTLNNSEVFAEETAINNGIGRGGSTGKTFINSTLRCSRWVVTYMKNNNGTFPPTPDPVGGECYGNLAW